MPSPPPNTIVQGIFQSDLIIRTAVIECLNEMLANPDLLDYVFSSMTQDPLTIGVYGIEDISKAKDWFLNTEIPVKFDIALEHAEWPAISISLLDSVESEFTIGDIHYQPTEPNFDTWPIIINKFTPVSYSISSGIMKIPASAVGSVILDTGMVLIDAVGRVFSVIEVLDDDTISLPVNSQGDFRSCMIKDGNPGLITPIESINNKETYQLGLYVPGEPIHLIYLHSILSFALNRRKQDLLEGRGFERSVMSSGKVEKYRPTDTEVVYARTINLVGYVRQTWIKDNKQVIQGTEIGDLTVGDDGSGPPGLDDNGQPNDGTKPWTVDANWAVNVGK